MRGGTDGGAGQFIGGGFTVTWVSTSRFSKSASEESPTSTMPLIGSTHANDAGLPVYEIWSHSVVSVVETEKIIRWPVTWVFSPSPCIQPPQAAASGEAARSARRRGEG